MTPNTDLPILNPLKARSTVAALVTVGAIVLPEVFGDIDPEAAGDTAMQLAEAVADIVSIAGMVWFWFERRAPHRRLGFGK
ncbi:hypothetical protein [Palleronia caenipelagi]|uniref:Uncharacterized protein n=1 Tax=Palleronia caenipelagi TaxID=2489174 RepID=A0A547PS71_9RHOB|nr:hypothetical protein [Palleronia caenipelagi]TRD16985.1 hypothetical protein FEV53_13695 [Palleronia caenipelagi]